MWITKDIVLLPSCELKPGMLCLTDDKLVIASSSKEHLFNSKCKGQHIYITSDEEIKENSLVLLPNNTIHRMNPSDMISYLDSQSKSTKLIIATTQSYMNLPQPSQQFIEKYIEEYNKGNIITKVEVEYEKTQETINYNKDLWKDCVSLKVNPDNTINIKPIKESWSKEELYLHLHKICSDLGDMTYGGDNPGCIITKEEVNTWIEEHL